MRIPDERVKRWVKLYDGTKDENRFINEQQRLESLAAILDIIMGYLKDDFPDEGESYDLDEAVLGIVDLVKSFERAGMTYQEAESFVTSLIAKGE